MDENVVFNKTNPDGTPASDPPPADPNAPGADPNGVSQADPSTTDPTAVDPNQPVTDTTLTDPAIDPNAVPADPAATDPNAVPPLTDQSIDPATGQPVDPSTVDPNATPAIDPATGQPIDPNAIDPTTGQPIDPNAQTEAGAAPPPPPAGFLGGGLLKKILIGVGALLVLGLLIFFLMPKGQTTQQVKLQWWGLWEEGNAMQALIADFEKDHPNIDVEYQKRTPQEYRDRLLARVDNGSGPDIFRYHNTWRPMLGDVLLPLSSDVITPDQFKERYYPVMQKDLVSNGAIYGIPLNADSLAMFVNPKLFEDAGVQVPSNWDDFVKVSKQLTIKDSTGKIQTAGAALGTYDNINHAPDIISLLFIQQGVKMEEFTTSAKSQADALEFYTSFATGNENVWDGTLDNSLLAFSRGKLAIYFGYSWDVFAIQRLNKDLQFKIYPVPELYGKKTTVASYWVEGVSSKSKNQKAALEFMKYLAEKETAEKFYAEAAKTRAFGEPYARKDLRENLREEPLVYPFLSQLDDASSSMFASDTHDGEAGLNTMLNTYLGTAVRAMTNDNDSAETVVEPLNAGVLQVYKKYAISEKKKK